MVQKVAKYISFFFRFFLNVILLLLNRKNIEYTYAYNNFLLIIVSTNGIITQNKIIYASIFVYFIYFCCKPFSYNTAR